MKIKKLRLVYFSPTGTTGRIMREIAKGTGIESVELRDITLPENRKEGFRPEEEELLLIGVPVYMGRVPALLKEWLSKLYAPGSPAVCVVVYGNRVYDDALLELQDILKERGCRPIAGAAYLGEHSFSDAQTPIAEGRPDKEDLKHAEFFGRRIREKLDITPFPDKLPDILIPGNFPYGGLTELWSLDFMEVNQQCNQCGICREVCPTGAISPENSRIFDKNKCITCCACIKSCPQKARSKKEGPLKDAAVRLNRLFRERKEPELFI